MRVSCYRLQKIFPSMKADSPSLMSDTRMCVGPRQGVTKCPAVHLAGGWSRTICHVMQSRFLVDFRMINRINRTIGCPAMKLCINIFLSLEYFVACNELNSLMSIIFYRHLDICLLFVDISWKSWHPSLLISHRGVKTWFSASRSSPDTSAGELQ